MTFFRILIVVLGAYYIIGIAGFQIGLKGPIENRMVSRFGLMWARIIYVAIGAAGIIFVLIGLI